jgi:hypothetical protein
MRLPVRQLCIYHFGDPTSEAKLRMATAGASEYQFIFYHPLVAGTILTEKKLNYYMIYSSEFWN